MTSFLTQTLRRGQFAFCHSFVICALVICHCASAPAQSLQREWVRAYSHLANKTNQPTAIVLTPDNGVVIAGTTYNENNNADYLLIKYNAAGELIWTLQHDTFDSRQDILRAMTTDPAGNIYVTGTTETLKVSPSGALVWPMDIPGRYLAVTDQYVYVTGGSETDMATTQLENNDTNGRDLFRIAINGPAMNLDRSYVVAVDKSADFYVANTQAISCNDTLCTQALLLQRYSPSGELRWQTNATSIFGGLCETKQITLGADNALHLFARGAFGVEYRKLSGDGIALDYATRSDWQRGNAFVYDPKDEGLYFTGTASRHSFVTKFGNIPTREIWHATYRTNDMLSSEGIAIAQGLRDELLVCANAVDNTGEGDIVLLSYDKSGTLEGLDRLRSSEGVTDSAAAMVVDAAGNVYVTGTRKFLSGERKGASEFLLIKYAAPTHLQIQKNQDGSMFLRAQISPNQPYTIQATTNFLTWTALTNMTNPQGIIEYLDTDAPAIPFRAYRGATQP